MSQPAAWITGPKLDIPSEQKDNKPCKPGLVAVLLKFGWPCLRRRIRLVSGNEAMLNRMTTHLIMVALIVVAIGSSKARLSWDGNRVIQPLKSSPPKPAATMARQAGNPLPLPTTLDDEHDDIIVRAAVPYTIMPDRAQEAITTYIVQSGDTVFGFAARHHFEIRQGTVQRNPIGFLP